MARAIFNTDGQLMSFMFVITMNNQFEREVLLNLKHPIPLVYACACALAQQGVK